MIGAGWFKLRGNAGEISGQVREAVTDTPISHANISIVGRAENDTTDDLGNFELLLQGLASDIKDVRAVIAKTGYQSVEQRVTVPKRDWVVELARQVETGDRHPLPEARVPAPKLEVSAQPIKIEFSGRPVTQTPGCSCGERDISFPGGPYTAAANEEFIFRYEDSRICRGQGFDNFRGAILWDGMQSTAMANNNKNDEFPGIAGSLRVRYSIPGDYNVSAALSLDCLDLRCRNTCSASGVTQVHIR